MSLTIVDFVKQQEPLFIKAATDERMVWAKESQFAIQLFQNNDYLAKVAFQNPNFIATQMGHTDAQMVYKVYGKWMSEKSAEQVSILNQALSHFAPPMPQTITQAL